MISQSVAHGRRTAPWVLSDDETAPPPAATVPTVVAALVSPAGRKLGMLTIGLMAAWIVAGSAVSAWRSFDHDLTVATRATPAAASAAALALRPAFAAVDPRRAALVDLLSRLRGAATSHPETIPASAAAQSPQRLLDETAFVAREQAGRLHAALKLTGAEPARAERGVDARTATDALASTADPRALAAMLNVDEAFALRIRDTAREVGAVKAMDAAVARLPLASPVAHPVLSSGFGVRADPFTEAHAFHAGQDFAGGYMTPIAATAPGVVSFTGERSGYGRTVEVDHGAGYKTRYAHLAAIGVRVGQAVAAGDRLGGMGSTGRSTGVHLHYEVWVQGRVQDPSRFLRAGEMLGAMAPTGLHLGSGGGTGSVTLASSGASPRVSKRALRAERRHGRIHAHFGG